MKRSKLKQSSTRKAELTLGSARNGRYTTIDQKKKLDSMTKFQIPRPFDFKRRPIQAGLLLLILMSSSIIVFIYGDFIHV